MKLESGFGEFKRLAQSDQKNKRFCMDLQKEGIRCGKKKIRVFRKFFPRPRTNDAKRGGTVFDGKGGGESWREALQLDGEPKAAEMVMGGGH